MQEIFETLALLGFCAS